MQLQSGTATAQSPSSTDRDAGLESKIPGRSQWPEVCALSFFAALVSFAIPWHEPWADEAQAWQLARALSLPDLFNTYLHYEVAPGLWHLLLWVLVRLHVTYTGMHWVCGAIAVASTSILIFRSPLPRYLKLTLPFSCFLLFQYAVVARNYVLAPLLLFAIAALWKKKNPLWVALLLGLLANVALHATAISAGLAIAYLIERTCEGDIKDRDRRRRLLIASSIAVCFFVFAVSTASPPKDLSHRMSYLGSESVSSFSWALLSIALGIYQPWALSFFFWIALACSLAVRKNLHFLLPFLFFAVFSAKAHASWWHVGLLTPLAISVLWITWPNQYASRDKRESPARIAMLVLAVMQIAWSANAIYFDHYHAYSPDKATAEFLRPWVQRGDKIAVTFSDQPERQAFRSVGIQPYFDHNIFANVPYSFWFWSDADPSEDRFNGLLPSHPRIVLVEVRYSGGVHPIDLNRPRFQTLQEAGYKYVTQFCGSMTENIGSLRSSCHVVFEFPNGPVSFAFLHSPTGKGL